MPMVELIAGDTERLEVQPLTVVQYHRMLELGILDKDKDEDEAEPVELLCGLLVPKDRGGRRVVSPRHSLTVHRFLPLVSRLEQGQLGCHLRIQSPVTIEPDHEPEPDVMIVRGRVAEYADRHPGPADVTCAIEVSESSLHRDLGLKLRIYAAAAIPQYVVVDLHRAHVQLHEVPDPDHSRYEDVTTLASGDELPLLLPGGRRLQLAVSSFLPCA